MYNDSYDLRIPSTISLHAYLVSSKGIRNRKDKTMSELNWTEYNIKGKGKEKRIVVRMPNLRSTLTTCFTTAGRLWRHLGGAITDRELDVEEEEEEDVDGTLLDDIRWPAWRAGVSEGGNSLWLVVPIRKKRGDRELLSMNNDHPRTIIIIIISQTLRIEGYIRRKYKI